VTVVATGLGRAQARPQLVQNTAEVLRTGTDNMPMGAMPAGGQGDYRNLDMPSVMRNPRSQASAQVRALESSGMDHFDIPAFLRKQAD
jgi:cell division protein FtsZ